MNHILYPASERGGANYGWLQAKHSFSFGQWQNPKKMNFGTLRVLNDDIIQGGGGFPTHPHENMEIITIPLKGSLKHKDSTGGEGEIKRGDIQIMSAGTGVQHSEYNASNTEVLQLLQIWIFPKVKNVNPRYDQQSFDETKRINQWQYIVTPAKNDNSLFINQDAYLALTHLEAQKTIEYNLQQNNNGIYLFILEGSILVGEQSLHKRDALGIYNTNTIQVSAIDHAEILLIEVPMVL